MKKFLYVLLAHLLVSQTAYAAQFHQVKKGESLSRLIERTFPDQRIYGKRGKLAEIIALNPQLSNPDKIYPGDIIYLTKEDEVLVENVSEPERTIIEDEGVIAPVDLENTEETYSHTENRIQNPWKVSLYWGVRDLSITQEEDLGKGDVKVVYFNNLSLHTEYLFPKASLGFQYNTLNMRYRAFGQTNEERIHSLFLYGSYRWMLAGLQFDQLPLFKNTRSEVEMMKMTPMFLNIGARKEFDLPWGQPTQLALKGWFGYPTSITTEKSDAKLSDLKGMSFTAQAELTHQLLVKPQYSLHATWLNGLSYKQLEQNGKWEELEGKVNTKVLDFSTNIGLLFKF